MTQVFLSYAHKDAVHLKSMVEHIKPLMRRLELTLWQDGNLKAGDYWNNEIHKAITASRIVISLITPAYLASDYIHTHEGPAILDVHKRFGVLVVPVYVQECDWQDLYKDILPAKPLGVPLQAIPSDASRNLKAVKSWKPQPAGWHAVTQQLDRSIAAFLAEPIQTPDLGPGPGLVAKEEGFDLSEAPPSPNERTANQNLFDALKRRADKLKEHLTGLHNTHEILANEIKDLLKELDRPFHEINLTAMASIGIGLSDMMTELEAADPAKTMTEAIEPLVKASITNLLKDHMILAMRLEESRRYILDLIEVRSLMGDIGEIRNQASLNLGAMATQEGLLTERAHEFVLSLKRSVDAAGLNSTDSLTQGMRLVAKAMIAFGEIVREWLDKVGGIPGAIGLLAATQQLTGFPNPETLQVTIRTAAHFLSQNHQSLIVLARHIPEISPFMEWVLNGSSDRPHSALAPEMDTTSAPPSDFDLDKAHEMILKGQAPPEAWIPYLTDLNFFNDKIKSLAALANLTALQTFKLMDTKVSDLSPLANLTALQTLDLRGTQVTDLGPLANLTALQTLDLRGTQVTDLGPLANLTALQNLYLEDTKVTDLGPLANLTDLQNLYLEDTKVTDLGPLANLTALQNLELWGTQVTDLSPLANLTALQNLKLTDTKVTDLGPLANLTALQNLFVSGTKVTNLGPLANLTALHYLNLCVTQVTDLGPLANLTALQNLFVSGTKVTDLGPLANLTALHYLNLCVTQVTDLGPLANLTALQYLNLEGCQIKTMPEIWESEDLELNLHQCEWPEFTPYPKVKAMIDPKGHWHGPEITTYPETRLKQRYERIQKTNA
jgi:hypothetical protein